MENLLQKIEKKYNVRSSYVTPTVRKKANGLKVFGGGYHVFINNDKTKSTFNETARKVYDRLLRTKK